MTVEKGYNDSGEMKILPIRKEKGENHYVVYPVRKADP
jgi:hypothetical protein